MSDGQSLDGTAYGKLYCTKCRDLVDETSFEHREADHDGAEGPEIVPIVDRQDGQYIAQRDDMGHVTPHVWMDLEGHQMCGRCHAVKVPTEVIEP